jgi:hypothetical protein
MAFTASPTTAADKWVRNLSSATESIRAGVQAVTQAPGQKAAAQRQKWLQSITDSADKWARRVAAVPLGAWQDAMINVGIPRVSSGAQAKQGKYASFATEFWPHLQSGVAKVQAMPSTTLDQRIQRAVTMMQHNAMFSRRGGS